jgi:hypothetical protein
MPPTFQEGRSALFDFNYVFVGDASPKEGERAKPNSEPVALIFDRQVTD